MPAKANTAAFKVVLIEDHQMFREWLGRMICEEGKFVVCGEADNTAAGLALIQQTKPDVVILDITLRGSGGLELLKDMQALGIDTPVLVLSMHDESLYAERAFRAGAKGYISKQAASSALFEALNRVLVGQTYLGESTMTAILENLTRRGGNKSSGIELLADRELEVFQLIGKGRKTAEIAAELHLGPSTVDTYRARIKEKLRLRNAAELHTCAVRWVQEHGV